VESNRHAPTIEALARPCNPKITRSPSPNRAGLRPGGAYDKVPGLNGAMKAGLPILEAAKKLRK